MTSILHRLSWRRSIGPGLALLLLAPTVAELCSGSTGLIPYLLLWWMMALFYGCGAILIREYTLRWGKGWPTILALGMAYAVAEEGIATRTFYDPTLPIMEYTRDYSWALGTNWVADVQIVLYHSIVGIAIPIFLVMLAYPARRTEPWVSGKWLLACAVGYVAVHLGWLLLYERPVDGEYIMVSLAIIAFLVWLARRLPARLNWAPGSGSVPTPRRVAIVCYAATVGVFLMCWGLGLGLPFQGAVMVMLGIFAVVASWLVRLSARPGWGERHRYAVAAGILFFLPSASWAVELNGARFQILVGIVTGYLLVRTWRRLRAAEAAGLAETAGTVPSTLPPTAAQAANEVMA